MQDANSGLVEPLVTKFLRARQNEDRPRTYRWFVDKNTLNRLYDEITPIARGVLGATYSDDVILLHTEAGTVPVVDAKEANAHPEKYGDVVAVIGLGPTLVAEDVDYGVER